MLIDVDVKRERPLNGAEKTGLVLSGLATIGVCYAFSLLSILVLAIILGVELLGILGAARFGVAGTVTPLFKRHVRLLAIFLRSFRPRKDAEYRIVLAESDAPRLFNAIARLAERFDIAPPSEVSIELGANAWVRLKGIRRSANGTILAIGYDLLAGLTQGEVQAVLAHEMGHAKAIRRGIRRWLDLGVMQIGSATSGLLEQVESFRREGKTYQLAEFLLRPSDALLRIAAWLLARYSRQDEFEADRISVELFGSASLRSALIKLELLNERLRRLPWTERVAQLETQNSFSEWLVGELRVSVDDFVWENRQARDPYSTHPSLRDRIAAMPADDGCQPISTPAIKLLSAPDRVAAKLMSEVHRIQADLEQKDTKSLNEWTRKNRRGLQTPSTQFPAVLLFIATFFIPLVLVSKDAAWSAALAFAGLAAATVLAWRWGRYKDRVMLPVPGFSAIKKAREADPPTDIAEQAERIQKELQDKGDLHSKKAQKMSMLIQEGLTALGRCDYLRAQVASLQVLELNKKSIDGALIYMTASAGMGQWADIEHNLEFVRSHTGFATLSTTWGAAWALSLAGDWARAEGLLWQALERQPNNSTFLALMALAQSQRGKLQSAALNAQKAVDLEPAIEHSKLLARILLDAGRLADAETCLRPIQHYATSDQQLAVLIVRHRLLRNRVDAALETAKLLRQDGISPSWLIVLGHAFDDAREDDHAVEFYSDALKAGHYPEALLGLARLAANRKETDQARKYLIEALNAETSVGPQGRPVTVLFHPILSQLLALEEPRENCAAWIATLPNDAVPSALAGCSLMLYGTSRKAAEDAVNFLASAMAPTSKVTPASTAQWRDAPRDQQPARPVCEGVQYVLS